MLVIDWRSLQVLTKGKIMRNALPFRLAAAFTIGVLLTLTTSVFAQANEQVLSYPVGSVAMFPESVGKSLPRAEKIHLRLMTGDDSVWDADSVAVPVPAEREQPTDGAVAPQTAIGFIVPQLPRGTYIA